MMTMVRCNHEGCTNQAYANKATAEEGWVFENFARSGWCPNHRPRTVGHHMDGERKMFTANGEWVAEHKDNPHVKVIRETSSRLFVCEWTGGDDLPT